MSSRRTLILIAAIAVGALAAFAIYNYVGGIEDRERGEAQLVAAVRVTGPIPRGTDGLTAEEANLLQPIQIPDDLYTGTEITDLSLIRDKIAGSDLVAGQILVEGLFVDPLTSRVTAARRIPDNNVAITIQVDDVRGVAGLIVPGDFVNMMALYEDICEAPGEVTTEEGTPLPEDSGLDFPATGIVNDDQVVQPGGQLALAVCTPATYVFQEVQVLFVDRTPIPLAGEAQTETVNADGTVSQTTTTVDTGLLTLAVPPDAAQLIASLPREAWYLTLLPSSYVPAPLPDFDPLVELLPGENPNQLTPYGPEGIQEEDAP